MIHVAIRKTMDKATLRFELHEDIHRIIKEYSMPVTRPDWRTLQKMPNDKYLTAYRNEYHKRILYIMNHPDWSNHPDLYNRRVILCRYKRVFGHKLC